MDLPSSFPALQYERRCERAGISWLPALLSDDDAAWRHIHLRAVCSRARTWRGRGMMRQPRLYLPRATRHQLWSSWSSWLFRRPSAHRRRHRTDAGTSGARLHLFDAE